MLHVPHVTISAATTPAAPASPPASPSEENATSRASSKSNPSFKARSCVVCRSRKVRCDKLSPCSNCRRTNIACVFPSNDRPPRWARRFQRVTDNAASNGQALQDPDPAPAQVMERLQNLESMVKALSDQLRQAKAATGSTAGGSSGINSPESSGFDHDADQQRYASDNTNAGSAKKYGRLVSPDASRSRYVSSGFWSRVNDELNGLQIDSRGLGTGDSETSEEDEASSGVLSSTQEFERAPSERHAFLFRHNLSASAADLCEFRPLPSQVPFLLDMFAENINSVIRIVHIPTVAQIVRELRGGEIKTLSPANEALMFSIYYAAITSMEDDDIMVNFGVSKNDLNLKYRLGLEHALAKADFLNVPDLVLVQAFAIFLGLARRHDSPRFVWMMTGLAVRMGQALGLHRDGAHFKHLSPFEIEMRRRAWWALCVLDARASEDQGTDFMIVRDSFDTKLPLNINDVDITPETVKMPTEREGITDMSLPLVFFKISEVTKQMMTYSATEGAPGIEEQSRLLNEIYQKLEQGYLQYAVESGNIAYWVGVTIARLVMAKMTLFVYLPILFSSPSQQFSDKIRTKLLIAAIEVAEYNHALNVEQACRHWRWVYQTYTHWYAIVYLLIEISRRPWSPIVERAWVALHSQWLIPVQSHKDKNLRVWIPLRKLTAKAKEHRRTDLEWLRNDPQAAERLEREDQKLLVPISPGPFQTKSTSVEAFCERWRQLLATPEEPAYGTRTPGHPGPGVFSPSAHSTYTTQTSTNSISAHNAANLGYTTNIRPVYQGVGGSRISHNRPGSTFPDLQSGTTVGASEMFAMGQTAGPLFNAVLTVPTTESRSPDFVPWLWAEADASFDDLAKMDVDATDVNMDLNDEVDWYRWVESAKGMEFDAGPNSQGRA